MDHADDLGALFVNRGGVEIIDGEVFFGAHRVGERAGVLGKLTRAQGANLADALDSRAAMVGRKLLIAKNGQAFLQ
jgi:hypothetical protein